MRTVNPEQHARKRAAILSAAAEEFAAHGVDGTSTADICRRAGIGSGTLFHYFATKSAIFSAIFADDLPGNAAARNRALASQRPDHGLDVLVEHLVADLADPLVPGLVAAALHQANQDQSFAQMLHDDDEQTRDTLTTLLTRMADAGHRLAFAPDRVAHWIQTLTDNSFLAADDSDFDPTTQQNELYQIIAWLTGRR